MLTSERRLEIEQYANRFGSANCWTGTSGTLATMIRELLSEIDRLTSEIERLNYESIHYTDRRVANRTKGESDVVSNRPSDTLPNAGSD